jgi:hypothetical protein
MTKYLFQSVDIIGFEEKWSESIVVKRQLLRVTHPSYNSACPRCGLIVRISRQPKEPIHRPISNVRRRLLDDTFLATAGRLIGNN